MVEVASCAVAVAAVIRAFPVTAAAQAQSICRTTRRVVVTWSLVAPLAAAYLLFTHLFIIPSIILRIIRMTS